MTLEELDRSLPCGLHDAFIHEVQISYVDARVVMRVSLWVSDGETTPREAYRDGHLVIDGLQFIAIEPPDRTYPFGKAGHLSIDSPTAPREHEFEALKALPKDCFAASLFVFNWNRCITVAGREARLEWTGEMYDQGAARSSSQ